MILERVYFPAIDQCNAINAAADPQVKRADMAAFYADLLRCMAIHGHDCIDWQAVNGAIQERWPKGLLWIKKMAWKELEGNTNG